MKSMTLFKTNEHTWVHMQKCIVYIDSRAGRALNFTRVRDTFFSDQDSFHSDDIRT